MLLILTLTPVFDLNQPVSLCAAKFCAWVLGVVQAAKWQRGTGHRRTDPILSNTGPQIRPQTWTGQRKDNKDLEEKDMPFHKKLAREKAKMLLQGLEDPPSSSSIKEKYKGQGITSLLRSSSPPLKTSSLYNSQSLNQLPKG
jgi:hypothetical protein